MSALHPGPGRTLAPRRAAFTTLETLIALSVFLVVMGIVLELWTGVVRSWMKGEDAVSSVQDASQVILHLRRDLLEIAFPEDHRPWDLRHRKIRGQDFVQDDLSYDPATRSLARVHRVSDVETTVYRQDETVLSFFVHDVLDGGFVPVTYTYLPEKRVVTRKVGNRPPMSFALPRLQDLEFQLEAEARGEVEGTPPLVLLGGPGEGTPPLRRLWFRVRFQVKGEAQERGPDTTRVDVETRIFPKALNRRLGSLWNHLP